MKMMTIGLGKREGADFCHEEGFGRMAHHIPLFGRCIIKNAPVKLGFAILENAYGETCKFAALRADEIEVEEPKLLEEARTHLPLVPFEETHVLVIDRIGKDISGDGMDPNVTGANPCTPHISGGLRSQRTAVLDITPASHGAAVGMGIAHTTTRRLFEKINYESTYVNVITARALEFVRIPCILDTDKEAVQLALRTCVAIDRTRPRIIRIADSLHTETLFVSEALREEAEKNPRVTIESGPEPWPFDAKGNLW
jgi:Arc/MetJ family transcription regulator